MTSRPMSQSPLRRDRRFPVEPCVGMKSPSRTSVRKKGRSRLPSPHRRQAALVGLMLGWLWGTAGPGQALDVSGAYRVQGTNPGGGGDYQGDVLVRKVGDVYQVVWVIGGQRHVGTGLLSDGVLSVAYQQSNRSAGVAVYRQDADGVLRGRWTPIGGTAAGTESWIAKDRT